MDAPPHHLSWQDVVEILKDYEFLVLFTSTMGWDGDQKMAEVIKQTYPSIKISFVGPPVTTSPDKALNECPAIDFICRREFDFSVVEYANGKPLNEILGISYKDASGKIQHNPDRPQVTPEQLTRCRGPPRSTTAISMSPNTTFLSCCIRMCRSTPPVAARRNALSACGPRRSVAMRGASGLPTTWRPR